MLDDEYDALGEDLDALDGDDTELDVGEDTGDDPVDAPDEGTEDEPIEDVVPAEAAAKKPGRASERIRRQQEEVKAAREEARRAREEAEALRRQHEASTAEAREQEQLARMSPGEQNAYLWDKRLRAIETTTQRQAFLHADLEDRQAFLAKVSKNPKLGAYADKVEAELGRLRAQGKNVDRDTLLTYLIGKDVLERGGGQAKKQAATAQRRVAAANSKPPPGRGSAGGRAGGESIVERMERLNPVI